MDYGLLAHRWYAIVVAFLQWGVGCRARRTLPQSRTTPRPRCWGSASCGVVSGATKPATVQPHTLPWVSPPLTSGIRWLVLLISGVDGFSRFHSGEWPHPVGCAHTGGAPLPVLASPRHGGRASRRYLWSYASCRKTDPGGNVEPLKASRIMIGSPW